MGAPEAGSTPFWAAGPFPQQVGCSRPISVPSGWLEVIHRAASELKSGGEGSDGLYCSVCFAGPFSSWPTWETGRGGLLTSLRLSLPKLLKDKVHCSEQ